MPRALWLYSALLALGLPTQARAQGPWRQVAQVGEVRIDLDTSRVAWQPDGTALVWLIWRDYAGAGADQVEHEHIDCRTHRVRVLWAQIRNRQDQTTSPAAVDSTWHSYVPGGLGARALGQVCAQLRLDRPRPIHGRGAAGA